MTNGINYSVLTAGDVVFTGGKKPFDYITRIVTTKEFKNRRNYDVPTHCGIVINIWGQFFIAEMNGRTGKMEINSLEKYVNNKKRWIVDIKRCDILQHPIAYRAIQSQIAVDYRYGIEYDYDGLIEFVLDKYHDNDEDLYCSEYVYLLTRSFITGYPKEFDDKVSPWDIYNLTDFKSVGHWEK